MGNVTPFGSHQHGKPVASPRSRRSHPTTGTTITDTMLRLRFFRTPDRVMVAVGISSRRAFASSEHTVADTRLGTWRSEKSADVERLALHRSVWWYSIMAFPWWSRFAGC